jgi:hypothetical protein
MFITLTKPNGVLKMFNLDHVITIATGEKGHGSRLSHSLYHREGEFIAVKESIEEIQSEIECTDLPFLLLTAINDAAQKKVFINFKYVLSIEPTDDTNENSGATLTIPIEIPFGGLQKTMYLNVAESDGEIQAMLDEMGLLTGDIEEDCEDEDGEENEEEIEDK